MECKRCSYVLDDPDRALREAESWQDVDDCCRETLELARMQVSLRAFLPSPVPSASLDDVILKAAARRFPAPGPAVMAPLAPVGTSGSVVGRLRRWVTGPQVAMAMITGLAVVIGVFYVPSSNAPMEAHGDTLVAGSEPESAAPEEQHDIANDLAAPKPNAQFVTSGATRTSSAAASTASPTVGDEPAGAAGPAELLAEGAVTRDQAARRSAATDDGFAGALAEQDTLAMLDEANARESVAPAPSALGGAPLRTTRAASGAAAAMPSMQAAMPAAAPPPAPAAAAAAPTTPTTSGDLLAQARAYRSRGQCGAAIPLYDRWLSEAAAGPRAEATMELAGCLVATGRTDRARVAYGRATTMPPVASRARAELETLDSVESERTETRAARARAPAAEAESAAPARAGAAEAAH